MTIKIEKNQIDELISTYLDANNMRYVDVDEPTHELCEFFAEKNHPVLILESDMVSMLVYTHHVEITHGDYGIDVYIRR